MQLYSINSTYQFHVKRSSHITRTRWVTIASTHCCSSARTHTRTHSEVLLINFHLLSPLWSGLSLSSHCCLSLSSAANQSNQLRAHCRAHMMMRDEWGRGDENDKLEYLKDTHDWKQLQCAARIIIYTRRDCECACVSVCVCACSTI